MSDIDRARDAAARADWPAAYELLKAQESLGPADLGLLADASYAVGDLDTTIGAWERSHTASLEAGDRLSAAAAAVRVALHMLMDTGLMAPVRGWTKRAERLLEGLDESPVHAWLAVARMYERLLSGDFAATREFARDAIEIGSAQNEPAPAAFGRMGSARALIYEGDVREGLALLDEAAVATMSGELDPLSEGMLYCELLCTCQALAQYDRADEWTDAAERWSRTNDAGSMGGRCRLHRAELLRLRGDTAEAEIEAMRACDELRPYLRLEFGWPLTELGRIRLRTGDLEGAEEAFVAASEVGWDPQPGLALLRLAQGDVETASGLIRDALDNPLNVPSKELPPNTDLRRAPLLEAQVEIAVAAGDLECARLATDELGAVAERFESKALNASAVLSRGRVALAEGDTSAAQRAFGEALRLWSEVGAPYEAGLARDGLSAAGQRVETEAVAPSRPARNLFRLEGDYWSVTFDRTTFRIRDLVGLRYLVRLLADPGREFHVLDLVGMEGGEPAIAGDSGSMLDAAAKEAYKRRIAEVDDDLEEARTFGDDHRAARAKAERDLLVRELSRAVGLGGRDRLANSTSERARASVTRAVRHAMARIREHDADLGEHLDRAVRTGTYCVYLPDPRVPVGWELSK